MKKLLLFSVLSLIFARQGFAADNAAATPKREEIIDQREVNQQKRIEQGVKSGELTKQETQNLEKREDKIKSDEANAMKDGKMSKKEFKKLEHEENRVSRDIHKKKRNNRKVVK